MTADPTTAAPANTIAPPRRVETLQQQAHDFWVSTLAWLHTHWVQVLIAAAVVAFGPWLGSLYSWIGTMVSAAVGFWLGRLTGGRLLRDLGGRGIQAFIAMIGRNGFLASLIVRLVPSAPFVAVNMAAGVTTMPFLAFAGGTALGIVPKILLTAMAIGVFVGMIQSATQLQEATIAFVHKLFGVGLVILLCGNWMLSSAVSYTHDLFNALPALLR